MLRATLAACLLVPALLGAQAPPAPPTPESERPLFGRGDLLVLGAFALGTVAVTPLDRAAAERLQNPNAQANRFFRGTATAVRTIAEPGSLIIGAALYGTGRATGNRRMAELGLHGTEAIVVGLATAGVVKGLAGRARPYVTADTNPRDFQLLRGFTNSDFASFPSGHTTMAFAAASAVTATTARWWPHSNWYVAPLMYGGATMVGLSRMYNNKHWASDVMVGAAIGTFSGVKIVRYHHTHPNNRLDRWLLSGSVSPGEGLRLGLLPGG